MGKVTPTRFCSCVEHQHTFTFPPQQAEGKERILKVATHLQRAYKIQPNDRVLLICDAGPESVILFHAVQMCGATFCMREPRMQPGTIKMMIDLIEPKLVITQPETNCDVTVVAGEAGEESSTTVRIDTTATTALIASAAADAADFPNLAKMAAAGGEGLPAVASCDILVFGAAVDGENASEDRSLPDQIAFMVTTSGTTGKPKAVMHSQEGACVFAPAG
jgi:acyl-coenzyme A synthetase/AMP-(fatty) acid ligase